MPDTLTVDAPNSEAKPIRVGSRPLMPPETVAFLEERLRRSACYLEYGSGGSTRLAVRLGVKRVFSVESDAAFARAVCAAVERDRRETQFRMVVAAIGPTRDLGYPAGTERCRAWPGYATEVWEAIRAEQASPDLILVDGRFRVACFLASLLQSAPGTTILFDDYAGRGERYDVVERHLKPIRMVDRAAVFETPETIDPRPVLLDWARYCMDSR